MASKGNASTKILTETVWFASQRKTSATTSPFLATSSTASPSRIMSEASCVRHLLEFSILKVKRALITGLAVAADVAHGHKAYRLPGLAAIRIRWRPAASGRSREVTNGSFVAAKLTEGHRASAAASGKSGCPVWVAMRLTSLRVRRRNVVVEFSLPGSSRSSPSADDPMQPLSFQESCRSTSELEGMGALRQELMAPGLL